LVAIFLAARGGDSSSSPHQAAKIEAS